LPGVPGLKPESMYDYVVSAVAYGGIPEEDDLLFLRQF
jgi:hypothetical protein